MLTLSRDWLGRERKLRSCLNTKGRRLDVGRTVTFTRPKDGEGMGYYHCGGIGTWILIYLKPKVMIQRTTLLSRLKEQEYPCLPAGK